MLREEPEKDVGVEENVLISAILQFRQSLQYLENRFMFSKLLSLPEDERNESTGQVEANFVLSIVFIGSKVSHGAMWAAEKRWSLARKKSTNDCSLARRISELC